MGNIISIRGSHITLTTIGNVKNHYSRILKSLIKISAKRINNRYELQRRE